MRAKGEAERLPPFSLWRPFGTMLQLDSSFLYGGTYDE